jgi:hypothetical protein
MFDQRQTGTQETEEPVRARRSDLHLRWWRGQDLNPATLGYSPDGGTLQTQRPLAIQIRHVPSLER